MSKDEAAIKPKASPLEVDLSQEEQDEVDQLKDDQLKDLAIHEGFRQVREIIEQHIDLLERNQHIATAIEEKDSLEVIGQKTIIGQLCAEILKGVLGQVDAAVNIQRDEE